MSTGEDLPAPEQVEATTTPQDLREAALSRLAAAYTERGHQFMHHTDPLFFHGSLYAGEPHAPMTLWKSDKKPRSDHEASSWLTASEFEDRADVMQLKVRQLAQLMRISRRTVVYSGAGISASVVGQAARSGTNKVGWTGVKTAAQPTPTHHALAMLGRRGLIHSWVQQNHGRCRPSNSGDLSSSPALTVIANVPRSPHPNQSLR